MGRLEGVALHRVGQVAPKLEATAELKTTVTTSCFSKPPASISPQRGLGFQQSVNAAQLCQPLSAVKAPSILMTIVKKKHCEIAKDDILPVPSERGFHQALDKVGWICWDSMNGRTAGFDSTMSRLFYIDKGPGGPNIFFLHCSFFMSKLNGRYFCWDRLQQTSVTLSSGASRYRR